MPICSNEGCEREWRRDRRRSSHDRHTLCPSCERLRKQKSRLAQRHAEQDMAALAAPATDDAPFLPTPPAAHSSPAAAAATPPTDSSSDDEMQPQLQRVAVAASRLPTSPSADDSLSDDEEDVMEDEDFMEDVLQRASSPESPDQEEDDGEGLDSSDQRWMIPAPSSAAAASAPTPVSSLCRNPRNEPRLCRGVSDATRILAASASFGSSGAIPRPLPPTSSSASASDRKSVV